MATYYARMMSADSPSGEGSYTFESDDKLMKRTADEIVNVFFDYVEADILKGNVDWELNGAVKNKEHGVVTAIGALVTDEGQASMPFLLMISTKA